MNSNIEAEEASFIVHAGDIVGGGSGVSQSKKCNDHVFQSRQDLFKGGTNLLLTTGDVRVNNFSLLSLVVHSLFPSLINITPYSTLTERLERMVRVWSFPCCFLVISMYMN